MTQHIAKLIHGPFDETIRSLPADTTLDGDREERGNPQLVIQYLRIIGGETEVRGMYLRMPIEPRNIAMGYDVRLSVEPDEHYISADTGRPAVSSTTRMEQNDREAD